MTQARKGRPGEKAASSKLVPTTDTIVPRSGDVAQGTRVPAAYATAYSPAGRRTRAAAMVRCPRCRGGHLIYASLLDDLGGVRTVACGRVFVVVARIVRAVHDAVA